MKKEWVAMLLAGGEGKRLGTLTRKIAKPAVPFGGKYRIIDFTLSNCTNSGIDTVGILTQYKPLVLHSYIGIGTSWGLDRKYGGVTVLPPFVRQSGGKWYNGTADAIYQNMYFIEGYNPEYVLILSGDHIYKMDYNLMLDFHKAKKADLSIAVIRVPWEEASRFGTIITNEQGQVTGFEEKPKKPKSNLASMGIYIFKWKTLKKFLLKDAENPQSSHDFGKDVIPLILKEKKRIFAYSFDGYWKDVGTVESLWEANMDLLEDKAGLNLYDPNWKIYSANPNFPSQFIAPSAKIKGSLINDGCLVYGQVRDSVLFYGVFVGENALVEDSIVLPNARIGANAVVHKAIVGSGMVVTEGSQIGSNMDCVGGDTDGREKPGIILVGDAG